MQKFFLQKIRQIPDYQKKKYLLAVSGGLDSLVLSFLFHQAKLNFEIAHCNFKLRGTESDEDQNFVEQLSRQLNVRLHMRICNAYKHPNNNIQLAARALRYQFFDELRQKYHFDYVVTAHHLDDAIETFFINLNRATGLKGLLGITENQGILRPLLNISRKEILQFAVEHQLKWREDSSNRADKYQRNYLRHHIIPSLKEINPNFDQSMQKTFEFLKETYAVVDDWFRQKKEDITTWKNEELHIDLSILSKIKQQQLFLYKLLSPYGFTDWKAILKLMKAQSGKAIFSNTHRLVKHQDMLILTAQEQEKHANCSVSKTQTKIDLPVAMQFNRLDKVSENKLKKAKKNEIYVDFDLLKFPLNIRKWQEGDFFYPFGMKGKKKLSDYFKDEKLSLADKEKIWLLCSGNEIVWIIGKRADNRFKINQQTKKIYKIELL